MVAVPFTQESRVGVILSERSESNFFVRDSAYGDFAKAKFRLRTFRPPLRMTRTKKRRAERGGILWGAPLNDKRGDEEWIVNTEEWKGVGKVEKESGRWKCQILRSGAPLNDKRGT